jgi:hypothetical protein
MRLSLIRTAFVVSYLAFAAGRLLANEDLPTLIQQLEADDFAARERAVAGLIKIGEPAREAIEDALKKSDSAEVKACAARVIKQFDLDRIQRDAFKLEDLLAELKGAEQEDWDRSRMAARLEKLMAVVSEASGRTCKLPAKFSDLPRGAVELYPKKKFIVFAGKGELGAAEDCVILMTGSGHIARASNCIVIARDAAAVGYPRNTVVVSGLHIEGAHASALDRPDLDIRPEGSCCVLFCGGTVSYSTAADCIVGAAQGAKIAHVSGESCMINTECEVAHRSDEAKEVIHKGIVLKMPPVDDPLKGRMTILELGFNRENRRFLKFRRTADDSEHTLFLRKDVLLPNGEKMPEFKDWKMTFATNKVAVFENGTQVSIQKWKK